MRTLAAAFAIFIACVLAGCQPGGASRRGFSVSAEKGGLLLQMSLPEGYYARGDVLPVEIAARNTSRQHILIETNSGALACVRLWRHTGLAWEEIKRFPSSAVMVVRRWQLPAGQSQQFTMNLDVTPDWPTGEPLKLTAELNGRGDVQAAALIEVFATRQECDRRRTY